MANILVIEDSDQIMEWLIERLQRRGHVVTVAHDAEAGISSAARQPPDVVLIEMDRGGVDGVAALHGIKHDVRTRDIPVIGLLTECGEESRRLAFGCDHLHAKPIDFFRLMTQIREAGSLAEDEPDEDIAA